jgi:hypothetical protein
MDCCICWEIFKEYELISGGCCSSKICKNCIIKLSDCPQCRKKYFFYNHDLINYYKHELTKYTYKSALLENDKINLIEKQKDMQEQIDFLTKCYVGKDQKINNLMKHIDHLHEKIDEEININNNNMELEKVIEKYNLN